MVRTRHSGDIEDVDSPKFMTLEKERFKSEASTKREIPDEDDINTPRGAYLDDEYELFEDKVVESRLRPRTGPRRAYNYLDADSSDDERGRRHRRHSPHKEARSPRSIKKELADDSDRKSRRISSRMSLYQEDAQEDNHQLRRSQRRSRHDQSVDDQSFEEDAKTRTGRRTLRVQNDEDEDTEDGHKEDEESDDEKEQDSDDEAAKDHDSDNEQASNAYSDMYSRVKRKRVRRSLNIYDDESQNRNNNQRDDTDEEEEPSSIRRSKRIDKKRGPPQIVKSYSLREHKPRTDLYKAPVEERRIKKPTTSIFEVTPTKKTSRQPYQSPAQRRKSRKRSAAMHSSSSSTSSSSGESSDEKSFRKRKAKSMAKARSRMMPMNFSNGQQPSSIVKDRAKSGASLADVEPMNIDKNISFDSIGGLGKHIRALKEMVVFPLLYDKVFQKFNVDPPRGVLFYGPPGTGKTLVARALANECSHGEKKVAFFMRKGADCLSKWVGESERQLRLLFDQAYKYRPSIIFFDEIDGLAPVRSSRQDQIHSSIVSTLLALMDGLDSRGEIVVIGATNRIDSLDPALRRPGRFDREFLFSLPTLEARKQILKIQTSSWNPKLNERFVSELAEKCVGYCGADLKSLCTEAAMLALRRRYPQIYISNEALQLDESSIQVCAKDFFNAVNNIIPTSRRSVNSPGRPLSLHILPLLQRQLDKAVYQLGDTFPPCLMKMTSLDAAATNKQAQAQTDAGMLLDDLASDEDDDAPSIFVAPSNKASRFQARKSLEEPSTSRQIDTYLNFASFSTHQPTTFRPRIMLTGLPGQGQTSYIAPALIHRMEDLPVHVLDLPALYAVTAKTPEESCATVFHEARRKCPSIIYMPYINQWWDVLGDTLRTTLLTLIQDLNPTTPLLLLATSEQPYSCLDIQLKSLFSDMSGEVMKMANPNAEERRTFFKDLILQHSCKAPPQKKTAEQMIKLLEQTEKTCFLPYTLSKSCEPRRMMRFTKHNKRLYRDNDSELFCKDKKMFDSSHKMTLRRRNSHGSNNNYNSSSKWNYSSSAVKFSSFCYSNIVRREAFDRFRQRFEKIRPNNKEVTRSKSCINTNFSNNHVTVRYLKRLNKNFCSLKLSDRHLRYLKRMGSCSVVLRDCLKKRVSKPQTCFSSGSMQMLYRKNDIGPYVRSGDDQMLPININYLQRVELKPGRSTSCRYHLRPKHKRVLGYRDFKQKGQSRDYTAKRMLEVLPKAVPVKPKELTNQEMNSLLEKEELTLMELRIFLRDVLHKLGSDKKFSIFTKPVNIENAPDYYEVIDNPMDMSTMMSKIDCHEYSTVRSFMDDVDLICSNALEYNPDRGPLDKVIRHRACALKDTAYAIIRTELDKDFEKMCVEIEESRKRRGVKSTTVPNFYRTKPAAAQNGEPSSRGTPIIPSYLDSTRPVRSIPKPDGERFSRRVRGIQIDPTPSLEDVEKKKSQLNNKKEKEEGDDNDDGMQSSNQISDIVVEGEESMLSQEMISDNESTKDVTGANDSQGDSESLPKPYHTGAQTDPLSKKSRSVKKCVWCRPSRRRRKKFFQDQMNSLRMMKAAKDGKEEKNIKINLSPPVTQPLNIDVSESTETEMKSPVRKSARIVSPGPLSSGVTTRRQSLSPRASRPNVETKVKDLPQEENPVQETVVTEVHEESVDEVVEKKNDESLVTEKTVQTNSTDVSELLEKKLETLKDAVETEAEPKKLSVVKSLDLDFGVVDSGAGSSLEGNGDSRDSMDNKEAQPTTSSSQIKDFNENNNQDRATKDSSIFNDCSNKLVVPTQKLSNLLDKLVAATEGSNVECLEKIYSQLSQIIFKHRNAYNRSDMVTELEKKVAEMTRQLPSLSSSR